VPYLILHLPPYRRPGLDPGSRFLFNGLMDRKALGGWVYIMADRYRGTLYVGVTADLPLRVSQHRSCTGSDFCARYGLTHLVWADRCDSIDTAIAHEKRVKRWRREWKFDLIEKANPDWNDLFDQLLA
jgi:putative endonuclease